MSTVSEGQLPYSVPKEENSPENAIIFVGISLVLGISVRHLLGGTRVPYTVSLLVLGIALGSLGESEIVSIVINKSNSKGEEGVRVRFPQVLHVVRTRQATYSILKHLSEYVQNLEKAGLLEQKEMLQLHDSVQTDLKKVLRNPPRVIMKNNLRPRDFPEP